MYAASLPKIAILLAAFDHFDKGKLKRTPEVEQDLHAMIRNSSNSAATRMIDRIGGLMQVNEVLRDPAITSMTRKRRIMGRQTLCQGGTARARSRQWISHAATVAQVCRFYYLLATGRLINPEASRDMLDML